MPPDRRTRPPLPLLIGFSVFLIAIGYLVAASLIPRDVPTFVPTPMGEIAARGEPTLWHASDGEYALAASPRVDTITIDAASPDDWRYFSFERRAILQPPDTIGWDVAVRRYHVRVAGHVADLGPAGAMAVTDSGPRFLSADGQDDESGHPALRRWYRYGMLTHLLESKRHAYLVRTADGRLAQIEVLSYYCPGPRPGCMTLRYAYPVQ